MADSFDCKYAEKDAKYLRSHENSDDKTVEITFETAVFNSLAFCCKSERIEASVISFVYGVDKKRIGDTSICHSLR